MKNTHYASIGTLLILVLLASTTLLGGKHESLAKSQAEIKGVSFVGPPRKLEENPFGRVQQVNASWVAVTPYGYSRGSAGDLIYQTRWQWWGEGPEGVKNLIQFAQEKNLKVMLKPHVWVIGQGWTGEYACETESCWQEWEKNYTEYAVVYARMAQEMNVDLFCIATEYRMVVRYRPLFWPRLIKAIKQVYTGPLTYAANWDNYQRVEFWDQLDYIGIDAYFPLVDKQMPTTAEIQNGWKPWGDKLEAFSQKWNKPILFTEYGYCSRDYAAKDPWAEHNDMEVNLELQKRTYEAMFNALWDQPWFAGGFAWKWYDNDTKAGGPSHKGFTPQNKPALEVMKERYGE
ncbi:MAG: hypothetical protein AAGI38_09680 [Bacteroidota bacterium]